MNGYIQIDTSAFEGKRKLKQLIDEGEITLAGNKRLKIYGKLNCWSGKRMLCTNRVFFADEGAAKLLGYRPCKHCMNNV